MMKRILFAVMVLASLPLAARAEFFNVNTGVQTNALPHAIKVNGNVIFDPSLKEAAVVGWREVPAVKAEAGETIVAVEYVQDSKDPLKLVPVVTKKSDAQVAEETAAMEAAIQAAMEQSAADRQKLRDEITAPFEKEQAEAIGKLFDLVRGVP